MHANTGGLEMVFLGKVIADELVWAVRCKGCGELYVIREVAAGEVTFPIPEQSIPCHKSQLLYAYRPIEMEALWAP